MKIRFSIHFNTRWGEELFVTGPSPLLGAHDVSRAFRLAYIHDGLWEGLLECDPARERILSYRYLVRNSSGSIFYEAGPERRLDLSGTVREIHARDRWTGNTADAPFLTAPFSRVFFAGPPATRSASAPLHPRELVFRVIVPNVPPGAAVKICGSVPALGGWDPAKAPLLRRQEGVRWEAGLPAAQAAGQEWEYKFLLEDPASGRLLWENGNNRTLTVPEISRDASVILEHGYAGLDTGRPRYAGCAVPVFSLRSRESHGIGDFRDLRLLVRWAVRTGQSWIQLLPVNDTSACLDWRDSYPYNCISSFALHPIYLNPGEMGTLNDAAAAREFREEGERLNRLAHVDYDRVLQSKMRFFRSLYRQEKENVFAEPACRSFLGQNREWLYPYAAFCVLRDRFGTADFSRWEQYARYRGEIADRLFAPDSPHREEAGFYLFLQYHAHKQLLRAREYAREHGVALKGDIPIGVSRHGADAWQHPHYFRFGQQAGAPPDAFSEQGQNWGFPTYNWERMEQDHYRWWKSRLAHLSLYFDAYRLDHILGFFRIWEIPAGLQSGQEGHFHPALTLTPREIRAAGVPFPDPEPATEPAANPAADPAMDLASNPVVNPIVDPAANLTADLAVNPAAKPAVNPAVNPIVDPAANLTADLAVNPAAEPAANPAAESAEDLAPTVPAAPAGTSGSICSGLFTPDPYRPGTWHPRIDGSRSTAYRQLAPEQQRAYDILSDRFFYRRNNSLWYDNAMRKLQQLIAAGNMLACGEDLGMLNESVSRCMQQLKILSLELEMMPKTPEGADPARWPYLSVCTTATHDTPTLRMWLGERAAQGDRSTAGAPDASPRDCREQLRRILDAPGMLAVFPLQDWLSISGELRNPNPADERINDPANPHHYWKYRMHLTLEELLGADAFNDRLRNLILASGRLPRR